MRIKHLEDTFELNLLQEGDRIILNYIVEKNFGNKEHSQFLPKPEKNFIFGDYMGKKIEKDSDFSYNGTKGDLIIQNPIELDVSFDKINSKIINFLEMLRDKKNLKNKKRENYSIDHFSEFPSYFWIYLIR